MTVEALQPLFASTSPIAIEKAGAATIPSERASIAQQLKETRAARSALEADAVADEKSHLAGAHETPSDDPARDREITRLERREKALAELLIESDDKITAVHARIKALTGPRNAAVDQLVSDMNEATLSELRSHMDAIHASLVRLFASGHVASALIEGEHRSRFTAIGLEGKIELLRYFQRVPAIVRPRGFAYTDSVFKDAREAASEIVSSIMKGN
jgi:hypothetical protein